MMRGLDRNKFDPMVAFFASEGSFIESRMHECQIKACFLDPDTTPASTQAATSSNTPAKNRDIERRVQTHLGRRASHAYRWLRSHYHYLREDRPRIGRLVRLIRENDIDLVHHNNTLSNAKAAARAARITGIPCVCHVRGFRELEPYDLRFARSVDLFVFISHAVQEDYRRQGVSTNGIVVHNVVDLNEFPSSVERSPEADGVRAEFGWDTGTPLVGVVGRLDWWKGHETFLEAVAQAATQVDNLRALIVGAPVDTPLGQRYNEELQAMTRSLGLENKVAFTGFRSDIARLMSAMDVVVLSSSTPEPFGRVVIEGMAAYKPVIATAAGGVLDIIRDGVEGRLVPIKNANAMSQAIVELTTSPEKAKEMGRAARQRVESKFTLPRQIAAIEHIYRTLLDTPPGDRASIQWQHILDMPGLGVGR